MNTTVVHKIIGVLFFLGGRRLMIRMIERIDRIYLMKEVAVIIVSDLLR